MPVSDDLAHFWGALVISTIHRFDVVLQAIDELGLDRLMDEDIVSSETGLARVVKPPECDL